LYGAWVVGSVLVAPITWEHHLVLLLLPLTGLLAALATREQGRSALPSALAFATAYLLLAFENVTLQRAGQWQFGSGWWIFSGTYLRDYFFADVRLVAVLLTFALVLLVLQKRHTEAA
jgi:hypothetical protein